MIQSKFGVSVKKEENLYREMKRFKIYEKDIQEKFIRSSGRGGQKINKTSNCVYLKHTPTDIEVKCSKDRSRSLNRFTARKRLVEKIEKLILGKEASKEKEFQKIRRQKRRRSKKAKEKILQNKHKQAQKKALRKKIDLAEEI